MSLSSTPNGRRVLFAALYFSEGAPIGFIWWALPTVLAAREESIGKITAFTAMLVWPWALKFLWAPLVDTLRGPRWGHRAWIVSAQLVMGATLMPLAWLDVQADMGAVYWLLLAHAFAATTQDVAIDAWAINLTDPSEHGRLNAAMAMGKYAGRWLFGAGLLIVWASLGPVLVIGALVACIWATTVLVVMSEDIPHAQESVGFRERVRTFRATLRDAFTLRNTWLGLVFALVSGAGFEAVGAIAGPLLVQMGYGVADAGWWRTAWIGALIAGAWLGGVSSDRWGHRRCVAAYVVERHFLEHGDVAAQRAVGREHEVTAVEGAGVLWPAWSAGSAPRASGRTCATSMAVTRQAAMHQLPGPKTRPCPATTACDATCEPCRACHNCRSAAWSAPRARKRRWTSAPARR